MLSTSDSLQVLQGAGRYVKACGQSERLSEGSLV